MFYLILAICYFVVAPVTLILLNHKYKWVRQETPQNESLNDVAAFILGMMFLWPLLICATIDENTELRIKIVTFFNNLFLPK